MRYPAMENNNMVPDSIFKVATHKEELELRKWARDNWKHGSEVNKLWHPIVRAEIAQMQAEYPALLVVAENKALSKGVHSAVVDALIKAWPEQAVEILEQLNYDSMNGCYYFSRWGMYVGVEYDGYI